MRLSVVDELVDRYPQLGECRESIVDVFQCLVKCLEAGGTIYLAGNGGSAADAEHIASELLKSFRLPRPLDDASKARLVESCPDHGEFLAEHLEAGLRVVSLNGHPAFASAWANDVDADLIFAQQITVYGGDKDVLLVISTSGNSLNLCHAVRAATANGTRTAALTGRDGGELGGLCDLTIRVPEDETFCVQELHLPVYHCLCASLERHFFGATDG